MATIFFDNTPAKVNFFRTSQIANHFWSTLVRDWMVAMFFGIVFLVVWILRSIINEYKDHMIAKHDDEILVNGKLFASRMRTEVVAKEKVEQDCLGRPMKFD